MVALWLIDLPEGTAIQGLLSLYGPFMESDLADQRWATLAQGGEAKGRVRKLKDGSSHVLQVGVKLSVRLANKMRQ